MEDYSVDSDDVKFRMEEFVWCTFFIVVSSRKSGKKNCFGSLIWQRLYSFRPLIYRTWILEGKSSIYHHHSQQGWVDDHPESSCGSIHPFLSISKTFFSFLRKENSAAKFWQNPFMKYLKPSSFHSLGSFVWCIEFPPSMPGWWNSSRQLGRCLGRWQRCLGDKIPPFWKDQTWCKFMVGSFTIVHCLGW